MFRSGRRSLGSGRVARVFFSLALLIWASPEFLARAQTMAPTPDALQTMKPSPQPSAAPRATTAPTLGTPAGDAAAAFASGNLSHADVLCRAAFQLGDHSAAMSAMRAELALWRNKLTEAEDVARNIDAQSPEAKVGQEVMAEVATRRNEEMADIYHKSASAAVTVPFLKKEPTPLLVGMVNGRAAAFTFSSALPRMTVSGDFASVLGVETTWEKPSHAGGKSGALERRAYLDRVDLSSLRVSAVPANIVSVRREGANSGEVDGWLGLQFLSHFRTTIDYPGAQVIFAPRNTAPRGGASKTTPLWLIDGQLFVEGAIGEADPALWLIDLGGGGTAVKVWDRSYLTQTGLISAPAPGAKRMGKANPQSVLLPTLRLGEIEAHSVTASLTSPPAGKGLPVKVTGSLGYEFFRQWIITLDFERMELTVESPPAG